MKDNRETNSKAVSTQISYVSSFIHNVPYAAQSDAQKLDIYLPSRGSKLFPVIIWIHPGGFFEGDKNGGGSADPLVLVDMAHLVSPILKRGYAVVSINYRLSHEAHFPALIYDAKAAVRWVKAKATEYDFDPEKIAAWGSSAGGYLAAFLAVSAGVAQLEDLSTGNPGESSRVIAAIDWFGPTDFFSMDSQTLQLGIKLWEGGHNSAASPESKLMGDQITQIQEKCTAASPTHYVKTDHAPIYIQHGKDDIIVPYLQSVNLTQQLKTVGRPNEVIFEIIEHAGHADPAFFKTENIDKMLDFLDKYMQ